MKIGKMDVYLIIDCNWDFKVVVLKEKDNNSVCLMRKWNCVSNTNKHISLFFIDSREDSS